MQQIVVIVILVVMTLILLDCDDDCDCDCDCGGARESSTTWSFKVIMLVMMIFAPISGC